MRAFDRRTVAGRTKQRGQNGDAVRPVRPANPGNPAESRPYQTGELETVRPLETGREVGGGRLELSASRM